MAGELSLDYICYLEQKWKSYLRKYDPWDPKKRILEEDIRDTIDDMKNNEPAGIMLYNFFYKNCSQAEGELKAYAAYLRNENQKKRK